MSKPSVSAYNVHKLCHSCFFKRMSSINTTVAKAPISSNNFKVPLSYGDESAKLLMYGDKLTKISVTISELLIR